MWIKRITRMRVVVVTLSVLLALSIGICVIASIIGDVTATDNLPPYSDFAPPTATVTANVPQALQQLAEQALVKDSVQGVTTALNAGTASVVVTVNVSLTTGLTAEQVKRITFDLNSAIWQARLPIATLTVDVLGPAAQPSGDSTLDKQGEALFSASKAHGVNWATEYPDSLWQEYDFAYIGS